MQNAMSLHWPPALQFSFPASQQVIQVQMLSQITPAPTRLDWASRRQPLRWTSVCRTFTGKFSQDQYLARKGLKKAGWRRRGYLTAIKSRKRCQLAPIGSFLFGMTLKRCLRLMKNEFYILVLTSHWMYTAPGNRAWLWWVPKIYSPENSQAPTPWAAGQ